MTVRETENIVAPYFNFEFHEDQWWDANSTLVDEDHPYYSAWQYAVRLRQSVLRGFIGD